MEPGTYDASSVLAVARAWSQCCRRATAARRSLTGGSMRHSQPDGSAMQTTRFRRRPSRFYMVTWENASRSIPRISRDQRLMAAFSCVWLRSVVSLRDETRDRNPRSGLVFRNKAEGVGFEPTRTRQRPNGFKERSWFGARIGSYLDFQPGRLLHYPRSSRAYPVKDSHRPVPHTVEEDLEGDE